MNLLINPAYERVASSTRRYKRLQGGGGSGKSIAVAKIILARVISSDGHRAFCFRKVARTVRDSVFKTFTDIIYEEGFTELFNINKSNYSIQFNYNGSEIICGGVDDPEKVKSIKDPTIIWMEEATEFNYDDFMQLDLRLRKPGIPLEFYLTYNPISKNNWIYEHFEERREYHEDEIYLKTTYKDNPYLPGQYVSMLKKLAKRSPEHWKVYGLGDWGEITKGLIFPRFEIINDIPNGNFIYGLDFGFNDPMSVVRVVIQDQSIFADEVYYRTGETIPSLISFFASNEEAHQITKTSLIYYDSARPGDGQQIYNAGYVGAKPAQKGQGSLESGIRVLQGYNLFVTARSVNLIRELNRYRWEEDKDGKLIDGKPIDAFNHAIDAMRYAVYTHTYKPEAIHVPRTVTRRGYRKQLR